MLPHLSLSRSLSHTTFQSSSPEIQNAARWYDSDGFLLVNQTKTMSASVSSDNDVYLGIFTNRVLTCLSFICVQKKRKISVDTFS